MKPVWSARTGTAAGAGAFAPFSASIQEDAGFVAHDVQGSVAHVLGLHAAGLLDGHAATGLVEGLQHLAAAHAKGTWSLDPALEDVHMNLEAVLTERLGDVGKRLHTGRSRNDQVATCLVLHAREGLLHVAQITHQVAAALAAHADAHAATPWVARTHAQPAQPATLGFLLAGHALRFSDLAAVALAAFDDLGESPLGCGAVAGSTLPLDPAYTASLLGLRPPRNALLATGSRPTVLSVATVAGNAGIAAASLAQDLMDLFGAHAVALAPGHTTGSSLMPQKRNPDALELVRGTGKALTGAWGTASALVAGLGLGYQRDLQATKPLQADALRSTTETLQVLLEVVEGATFDADVLAATLDAPGITATDMAEALVAHGKPFRDAYTALAAAFQAVEAGAPLAAALGQAGLDETETQVALAASTPDPARRDTLAGPAPARVRDAVAALQQTLLGQGTHLADARFATGIPQALLDAPVEELLNEVLA